MCLHSQTRLRSPLRSWLPTCSFLTLMPTFYLFQEVPAKLGVRACACTHRHTCTLIPCTCQKCESHSVMSDTLRPHGLYSPWNYPGQNTGVGGCSLLQEIFPTLGLKPGLPHCRWILYRLSQQGSLQSSEASCITQCGPCSHALDPYDLQRASKATYFGAESQDQKNWGNCCFKTTLLR